MKMWTGKAMHTLFELLPDIEVNGKKVGFYARDEWLDGRGPYPSKFTKEEWSCVEDLLREKMIAKGCFPGKKPKSGQSVGFFIYQAVIPCSADRMRGFQARARDAAYRTGFMQMRDIVHLEELAAERAGSKQEKISASAC